MLANYKEKVKMEAFIEYFNYLKERMTKFKEEIEADEIKENIKDYRFGYESWVARTFFFDNFIQHRARKIKNAKMYSTEEGKIVLETMRVTYSIGKLIYDKESDLKILAQKLNDVAEKLDKLSEEEKRIVIEKADKKDIQNICDILSDYLK